MMPWRIRAKLADRTGSREWVSPDIRLERPGWGDQVFASPIERVELSFECKNLILSGMEAYTFFIDGLMVLGSQRLIPQAFYFLGRLPGQINQRVSMWRILPRGHCDHAYMPWGREYHGAPVAGWKPGAIGGVVISRVDHAGLEVRSC